MNKRTIKIRQQIMFFQETTCVSIQNNISYYCYYYQYYYLRQMVTIQETKKQGHGSCKVILPPRGSQMLCSSRHEWKLLGLGQRRRCGGSSFCTVLLVITKAWSEATNISTPALLASFLGTQCCHIRARVTYSIQKMQQQV